MSNRKRTADEAREYTSDRKLDVPLKWFKVSGLRPMVPKSFHCTCMPAGADVTDFKM